MALSGIICTALVPALLSNSHAAGADGLDHCFTTDGTPQLVAALAQWAAVADVRDCGTSGAPRLRSVRALPAAYQSMNAGSAYPIPGGYAIAVRDDFAGDEWVWLHEVGHALGLEHSTDRTAVMFGEGYGVHPRELQADDLAAAIAIWGPAVRSYRYMVGVAHNP